MKFLIPVTLVLLLAGCEGIEFETVDTMTLPELVDHCQQGDAYSCVQLGNEYRAIHDFSNAAKYYVKACDMDSRDGCREATRIYFEGGPNLPRSLSESKKYAEKCCSLAEWAGCSYLRAIGPLEGKNAVKGKSE